MKVFMVSLVLVGIFTIVSVMVVAIVETRRMDKERK